MRRNQSAEGLAGWWVGLDGGGAAAAAGGGDAGN
jgi:hypothetical protein